MRKGASKFFSQKLGLSFAEWVLILSIGFCAVCLFLGVLAMFIGAVK